MNEKENLIQNVIKPAVQSELDKYKGKNLQWTEGFKGEKLVDRVTYSLSYGKHTVKITYWFEERNENYLTCKFWYSDKLTAFDDTQNISINKLDESVITGQIREVANILTSK